MNIIFFRYKSICEPDYMDAFKALGLNVVEDCDGMVSSLSLEQKINNLGNLIFENKPLFVFSINFLPFIAILCEKLHVFYVAETVDCPVFEIFNTSIRSQFNRVFLFDKKQYEMISAENPNGIFYLPLGAACDRLNNTLKDTTGYKYDVSFVGSLYNEKDPLNKLQNLSDRTCNEINSAIDLQLKDKVYGQDILDEKLSSETVEELQSKSDLFYSSSLSVFDISRYVALSDYLCPHITTVERTMLLNKLADSVPNSSVHLFTLSNTSRLSSKIVLHKGIDSLVGMPKVFRQSKINLNITTRSITSGLSQRIWDVLACRGFLITNYQPEIDMYFKDGVHLVTYKSHSELIEKADYYINSPDEREKIANNGYAKVNREDSIITRVINMIKTITDTSTS